MKTRRLPDWLRISVPFSNSISHIEELVRGNGLNTVCHHAKCPNRAECYGRGTLTFMILGDTCTRNCTYCNVSTGLPAEIDADEPEKIGKAVRDLKLKYAVVTSVTRDDLSDKGAGHFAGTVSAIRQYSKNTKIEVLVPDFQNDHESLKIIMASKPDVIGHNIETVKRLFPVVRKQADYMQSLSVLRYFKQNSQNTVIKSGLMIGMGETEKEIRQTLEDVLSAGVSSLTIGQYLSPSPSHIPVSKYYTPAEFSIFKAAAEESGFRHVESGPFVRSSYYAEQSACF